MDRYGTTDLAPNLDLNEPPEPPLGRPDRIGASASRVVGLLCVGTVIMASGAIAWLRLRDSFYFYIDDFPQFDMAARHGLSYELLTMDAFQELAPINRLGHLFMLDALNLNRRAGAVVAAVLLGCTLSATAWMTYELDLTLLRRCLILVASGGSLTFLETAVWNDAVWHIFGALIATSLTIAMHLRALRTGRRWRHLVSVVTFAVGLLTQGASSVRVAVDCVYGSAPRLARRTGSRTVQPAVVTASAVDGDDRSWCGRGDLDQDQLLFVRRSGFGRDIQDPAHSADQLPAPTVGRDPVRRPDLDDRAVSHAVGHRDRMRIPDLAGRAKPRTDPVFLQHFPVGLGLPHREPLAERRHRRRDSRAIAQRQLPDGAHLRRVVHYAVGAPVSRTTRKGQPPLVHHRRHRGYRGAADLRDGAGRNTRRQDLGLAKIRACRPDRRQGLRTDLDRRRRDRSDARTRQPVPRLGGVLRPAGPAAAAVTTWLGAWERDRSAGHVRRQRKPDQGRAPDDGRRQPSGLGGHECFASRGHVHESGNHGALALNLDQQVAGGGPQLAGITYSSDVDPPLDIQTANGGTTNPPDVPYPIASDEHTGLLPMAPTDGTIDRVIVSGLPVPASLCVSSLIVVWLPLAQTDGRSWLVDHYATWISLAILAPCSSEAER